MERIKREDWKLLDKNDFIGMEIMDRYFLGTRKFIPLFIAHNKGILTRPQLGAFNNPRTIENNWIKDTYIIKSCDVEDLLIKANYNKCKVYKFNTFLDLIKWLD